MVKNWKAQICFNLRSFYRCLYSRILWFFMIFRQFWHRVMHITYRSWSKTGKLKSALICGNFWWFFWQLWHRVMQITYRNWPKTELELWTQKGIVNNKNLNLPSATKRNQASCACFKDGGSCYTCQSPKIFQILARVLDLNNTSSSHKVSDDILPSSKATHKINAKHENGEGY